MILRIIYLIASLLILSTPFVAAIGAARLFKMMRYLRGAGRAISKYSAILLICIAAGQVGQLIAEMKNAPGMHVSTWWVSWWVGSRVTIAIGIWLSVLNLTGVLDNGHARPKPQEPPVSLPSEW